MTDDDFDSEWLVDDELEDAKLDTLPHVGVLAVPSACATALRGAATFDELVDPHLHYRADNPSCPMIFDDASEDEGRQFCAH